MAAPKPRHTTRFLASAHLYTPPAGEMVAMASLDKLRALLPAGVDPEAQPALLFIAANLAVGGVVNLNEDGLTVADTLRTYRGFEWQLVDIEHDRTQLRGFIVKAGLSELGTDRILTEDEARAAGNPVNIAVVIALWKVVDPDLCAFIERMDAPASPDRGKLSLSFEVGFDDYDIAVLPKGATNLALATQIVPANALSFGMYDRHLRVNGGKGTYEDSHLARVLVGNIVPLGAGIVTVPAAAVKGLTTITFSPHTTDTSAALVEETDAGLYKYSSTQCTLSEADAAPFKAYAASIPDDHIYTDPDDPTVGRMTEDFHATCLYGITSADSAQVQACLTNAGPITMTMGKVSAFEGEGRPYDVLKCEVLGDDIHRVHHLIKTATATEVKWPTFVPHLTLGYLKPGMARGYVGDTRFEGKTLTFSSLTFSPHTGDRIEIPLTGAPQSAAAEVYPLDDAMTKTVQISAEFTGLSESLVREVQAGLTAVSRQIKLSEGWQTRLAFLQAEAGKQGNAPLVNGVNITLSDGRTFSNVHVFDGQTLQLDKELSMSGVVITDMTPGARPQADDQVVETPTKSLIYPTTSPEQQARNDAHSAALNVAQNTAYTDAGLHLVTEDEVIAAADKAKQPYGDVQYADPGYQKDGKKRYPIDTPEHIRAAWSYINKAANCGEYSSAQCASIKAKITAAWKSKIDKAGPEGAKAALSEGGQTILAQALGRLTANSIAASVSPSHNPTSSPMNLADLKQSLAAVKTVEDLPTVVANVSLFADAIAAASEQMVKERTAAQDATKAAQASVDQIKAELATITKTHNELVAAQQALAAEAQFNEHMVSVEATFDLDDEVRAEIVDEVKTCVTNEAFAKWFASAKKKMKGFMKKKGGDDDADDATAKAAAKLALASAAANIVDSPISSANTTFGATPTLAEQMKATFANNISINGVKVSAITKSAKK